MEILGDSVLPRQVGAPFDVPASLRFAIPDALPAKRQSKRALAIHLASLTSESANTRRASAFDLGGWSASDVVDDQLFSRLASEPDHYVRSIILLSLALRNAEGSRDLISPAMKIVEYSQRAQGNALTALAGSMALLASAIVVARSPSRRCREVAAMADAMTSIPTERPRAESLRAIIFEHCEGLWTE